MRNSKVLSISLPTEMLEAAELMAKQENRTMSELMREALRAYQRERQAWRDLVAKLPQMPPSPPGLDSSPPPPSPPSLPQHMVTNRN